jgi:hypothetical protein
MPSPPLDCFFVQTGRVLLAAEMVALAAVRKALYIIGAIRWQLDGHFVGLAKTRNWGYIMAGPELSSAHDAGTP